VKEAFVAWQPRFDKDRELIELCDSICTAYAAQGFTLSLRQLYYQLVTRNAILNEDRSYKNLGTLVSNARRAGMIDWAHIEDRGRATYGRTHWDSPREILEGVAYSYSIDTWADQDAYVEVWVEKDALVDVVGRPCGRWDVRYFACKGYASDSAMYSAAQRMARQVRVGRDVYVFHLGDHDPSGLDMTRDITDRLGLFMERQAYGLTVDRIALNRAQIDRYNPPPNPAKVTDSRSAGYIDEHGQYSWELDALDPTVLAGLIDDAIGTVVDMGRLERQRAAQDEERELLGRLARQWETVRGTL
jgi:hypothetical protein